MTDAPRQTKQAWRRVVGSRLRAAARQLTAGRDFDGVERYVMFVGYPRSGHSLVGALLNAHRHAVIAHELDALHYVAKGVSRNRLYSLILERDRQFTASGAQWTGYSYRVPDQWQGSFEELRVIGDKKGGLSVLRLDTDAGLLDRLEGLVEVPVQYLHVVRNVFDNIATMSMRSDQPLAEAADAYFLRASLIQRMVEGPRGDRTLTVDYEQLFDDAQRELAAICRFIGVEPTEDYLEACAGIVFRSPTRSRSKVEWDAGLLEDIRRRSAEIPFLAHHDFGS